MEDSTGRSENARIRIKRLDNINVICATGYPFSFILLFPEILSLKTPITAKIGKIPNEKPRYVRIWSNVPYKTIMIEIAACNNMAMDGTLVTGLILATDLKK